MAISDDMQLLLEYANSNSDKAFATLVSRHVNLVYSAAFRYVANQHQAQEITQAVFIVLARKAGKLSKSTILSGWLYQTARLTAANFLRTENRRHQREQEAYMRSTLNESEPDLWKQIGPLLDEAMAQLTEADRNAVVLRFFEGKPLKEVGAALGASDDAAKMRVNRAVEKLRGIFQKRGVALSSAGLAASIVEYSVQAAPTGLSAAVMLGIGSGATVASSTILLAKGTLNLMAWSKTSIAIGVAAVALVGVEWTQMSSAQHRAAQLQEQLERAIHSNQTVRLEAARLDKDNLSLARQLESAAHDTAKARNHNSAAVAAAVAAAQKAKGKSMADLMKDPAMIDAMRKMQETVIRKQYAAMVKQMSLSPEKAEAFYTALIDHAMAGMSSRADVLAGQKQNVPQGAGDFAENLQSLLGADDYAQYKEYAPTVTARAQIEQMKGDFIQGQNPLNDDQEQRLMQTMVAAHQQVFGNGSGWQASSVGDGFVTTGSVDSSTGDPMAKMSQAVDQEQSVNQLVLQQAANFLSAGQLQILGGSQSNTLSMMKMGMAMAQKMYGIELGPGAAPGH